MNCELYLAVVSSLSVHSSVCHKLQDTSRKNSPSQAEVTVPPSQPKKSSFIYKKWEQTPLILVKPYASPLLFSCSVVFTMLHVLLFLICKEQSKLVKMTFSNLIWTIRTPKCILYPSEGNQVFRLS